MRIISLQAENFKKLQAIEITPDGNFVQITGKNGQGKSSTLDAIWVALAGLDASPKRPIRKGAESARIRLDLGEIKVMRYFKETTEGAFTSSLTVESAAGARYQSPQKMLDGLIGALSFDPVAFIAMEPKGQFNYCRRFVPEIDFEELANADRGDRQRREELGRLEKQERAAATVIVVPADTPEAETDITALTCELEEAGKKNLAEQERKGRYDNAVQKVADLRARAQGTLKQIPLDRADREQDCNRELADIEAQIRQLQDRAIQTSQRWENSIKENESVLTQRAKALNQEADDMHGRIDASKPFDKPIDTGALVTRISAARVLNENVRKLIERNKHRSTADRLAQQYKDLTAAIQKREADKQTAISAAVMPIQGLSFGEGIVLFNNVPLDQASDAEKLRVSVALSMAANPKLKVVFIRNGSLLDEDGLRLVAEMADQQGVQVWIERVASDGKVGIVLEDGRIKGHEETVA